MLRRLLLAVAFGTGLAACAQPAPSGPATAAPAASEAAVRATLAAALPGQTIRQLRPAPVAGFTEVAIAGRVLYVSNDGRYVFDGALIDFQTRRNLTEAVMDGIRVEGLRSIPTAERIVFAPRNPKHTVTVFTDISCGYCRLFHQKIAEYNALGIAVEYLFFPRAGEGSEAWAQAEAVWCARDPRQAMTDAKAGKPVARRECRNPVAREFALGREVGVSGTPAIYTAAGVHIGGYLEPARMLEALEALQRQAAAP